MEISYFQHLGLVKELRAQPWHGVYAAINRSFLSPTLSNQVVKGINAPQKGFF